METKPGGILSLQYWEGPGSGLVNRPLASVITDQIAGYKSRYPSDGLRYGEVTNGIQVGGLSMAREKELIQKWYDAN